MVSAPWNILTESEGLHQGAIDPAPWLYLPLLYSCIGCNKHTGTFDKRSQMFLLVSKDVTQSLLLGVEDVGIASLNDGQA